MISLNLPHTFLLTNHTLVPYTRLMVGVDRLGRMLRIIGVTSSLESFISCVFIAASDSGKTQLLLKNLPHGARMLTDFTYANLISLFSEKEMPRWIVVPDLNAVISHRPAVAQLTMACLLSLLGEGIMEIPGLEGIPKLKMEAIRKRGIHCGFLTAVTPEIFRSKRGKWRQIGLLRRLVPIYYSYSASTVSEINESIRIGQDEMDYKPEEGKHFKSKDFQIPATISAKIESLAQSVVASQLIWHGEDKTGRTYLVRATELPFTLHKIFRTFVKASALVRRDSRVNAADLGMLEDFARFVRYDRPEEI